MVVRIVPSDGPAPEEKLADVELVFEEGVLSGMKLVGFSVWRSRRRALPVVTFPSRSFQVNGERRAYALLRPDSPGGSQEVVRALILQAYMEYERQHPQLVERVADEGGEGTGAPANASAEGNGEADEHMVHAPPRSTGSELSLADDRQ